MAPVAAAAAENAPTFWCIRFFLFVDAVSQCTRVSVCAQKKMAPVAAAAAENAPIWCLFCFVCTLLHSGVRFSQSEGV